MEKHESPIDHRLYSLSKISTMTNEFREHRQGLEFIEIAGVRLHEPTLRQ
jgi:hypothetical protein